MREGKDKDGNVKYDSATGAKGYRWLESEVVRNRGMDDAIDRSYYDALVDGAVDTSKRNLPAGLAANLSEADGLP